MWQSAEISYDFIKKTIQAKKGLPPLQTTPRDPRFDFSCEEKESFHSLPKRKPNRWMNTLCCVWNQKGTTCKKYISVGKIPSVLTGTAWNFLPCGGSRNDHESKPNSDISCWKCMGHMSTEKMHPFFPISAFFFENLARVLPPKYIKRKNLWLLPLTGILDPRLLTLAIYRHKNFISHSRVFQYFLYWCQAASQETCSRKHFLSDLMFLWN